MQFVVHHFQGIDKNKIHKIEDVKIQNYSDPKILTLYNIPPFKLKLVTGKLNDWLT